jgi:hypothetical protein
MSDFNLEKKENAHSLNITDCDLMGDELLTSSTDKSVKKFNSALE